MIIVHQGSIPNEWMRCGAFKPIVENIQVLEGAQSPHSKVPASISFLSEACK